MNHRIRIADPERDYQQIADLMNTFERQKITADTLREWDNRGGEGLIRRRSVGVDERASIIGYSVVMHDVWEKPGQFVLWVIVQPDHRDQGWGTALYNHALDFACANGATLLRTDVLDSDPVSQAFAERQGFMVDHHLFESTIDLHAFDEGKFTGLIESVAAGGIRFFSLADAGDTREARYKLWEVNYQTYMDDPASTGAFPGFDEFNQIFSISEWFRPDGQLLAADGDRYVGLSAVGYFKETNSAYNLMTGVMPDYRGRKIALALKLLSIRAAQGWGADYIRTNNDSTNAPMLAINRRLGYVPHPGLYRMVNRLKD